MRFKMVHEIHATDANELFSNLSRLLLNKGLKVSPRELETIELEHVWFMLLDPTKNIVKLKSRELDHDYLKAEMAWYLSGNLNPDAIIKASKFWNKLKNPDGTVNSNYGHFAFYQLINGQSQYAWCLKRLREDKNSRQAVINYNQPLHKFEDNKDFVCTLAQLFRIKDNCLDSTVLMRSQDLIYGLSYDLPWFTYVQRKLATDLKCQVGVYRQYIASLHVYEKHYGMLEKMSSERFK